MRHPGGPDQRHELCDRRCENTSEQNDDAGRWLPGRGADRHPDERYLAHHTASSTALYVISSGDNDVAFALKHPGNKQLSTEGRLRACDRDLRADAKWQSRKIHYCCRSAAVIWQYATEKAFRATYNTKLQNKLKALHVSYLWGDADGVRHLMESYKNNPMGSPFHITNYTLGSASCAGTCSACPAADTGFQTYSRLSPLTGRTYVRHLPARRRCRRTTPLRNGPTTTTMPPADRAS